MTSSWKLSFSIDTPRTSLHYRPGTAARAGPCIFDLPLEIRHEIYNHLFQPDHPHVNIKRKLSYIHSKQVVHTAFRSPQSLEAEAKIWEPKGIAWQAFLEWKKKLLYISPIIHDEALEFLYKPLRFHFGVGEDLRDFMRDIGPRDRRLIAGVEIPYVGDRDGQQLRPVNLEEGIRLLRESLHLVWVKITVHDYDLAIASEDVYQHPASCLRGLKHVEIFRHRFLGRVGRGKLVDGDACARYWEQLRLTMLKPSGC